MLFQWTVQQAQKQENAKRFRPGYLCLISLCSRTRCCIDQQAGDVIVAINKAKLQPRTTSDGDSLLLPPFHRFGFLILPSFPPLIHYPAALIVTFFSPSFHFQSSDVSSRFSWMANSKEEIEGTWLTFFSFLAMNFSKSMPLPRSCQIVVWMIEEKNSSKHMVFVCSLNWINWRPMGNHRGG